MFLRWHQEVQQDHTPIAHIVSLPLLIPGWSHSLSCFPCLLCAMSWESRDGQDHLLVKPGAHLLKPPP